MLYDAYYEELEHYAEKEGTFTLGLKGQMLQKADELMKNDGKKFLEVMEKLAERRMKKQLDEEEDEEHEYPESEVDEDEVVRLLPPLSPHSPFPLSRSSSAHSHPVRGGDLR